METFIYFEIIIYIMRTINKELQTRRVYELLDLIKTYPEAIELNVSKLARVSHIRLDNYQILMRTWKQLKPHVKFKMQDIHYSTFISDK